MDWDIIYTSEYIRITKQPDGFYIESYKKGMSLDVFSNIIECHPEIGITSFFAIKDALQFAPKPPVKFGEEKEKVTVEVSGDELEAYVTLNASEAEINGEKKAAFIKEVIRKLRENGIVFGVKQEVLLNELVNKKKILIAEGILPVDGQDSETRFYQLKDVKPEIKEDGKVDHYELNLINRVHAGEWLGERIDPTKGTPGKSVKGRVILPMPGKKYPLAYDKKSVKEVYESGVTTLYSLRNGAVHFEGEQIGVSNYLEIANNVDFKTGNIDFDGFLTVKGSIDDNFAVIANKDIEVLGDYGIGSVREVFSREGSVFIRGGITGRNKAVIRSKKNIYTKYVSDAAIVCEGSVHIGYYCLNSNITAKEVILDSPKGQIIGGKIQAEIRVVSSIVGSTSEKRTVIEVSGFDRKELKNRLDSLILMVEDYKNQLAKCKQEVAIYTNASELSIEQTSAYERVKEKFFELRNSLNGLEEEKRLVQNYLRTHGEGEISILKRAYPNSLLEIKKMSKEINSVILKTCYYVKDGELKEL